jgi:hypothetical protein
MSTDGNVSSWAGRRESECPGHGTHPTSQVVPLCLGALTDVQRRQHSSKEERDIRKAAKQLVGVVCCRNKAEREVVDLTIVLRRRVVLLDQGGG